jgi:CBS domain-containing protein
MSNKVRDWMSSPVIVVDPDTTVSYALTLMRRRNIHNMPVADESGELIGIISATDIFIAADEIGWGQDA